jgi:hypothetical protein
MCGAQCRAPVTAGCPSASTAMLCLPAFSLQTSCSPSALFIRSTMVVAMLVLQHRSDAHYA